MWHGCGMCRRSLSPYERRSDGVVEERAIGKMEIEKASLIWTEGVVIRIYRFLR